MKRVIIKDAKISPKRKYENRKDRDMDNLR
jgi:hypothetical protein